MIVVGWEYNQLIQKLRKLSNHNKKYDFMYNISPRMGGPYVYLKRGSMDVGLDCKLVILRTLKLYRTKNP